MDSRLCILIVEPTLILSSMTLDPNEPTYSDIESPVQKYSFPFLPHSILTHIFFKKERKKEERKDPLKRQEGREVALPCFFPLGEAPSWSLCRGLLCPPLWECCCHQAAGRLSSYGQKCLPRAGRQSLQPPAEDRYLGTVWAYPSGRSPHFLPRSSHFCLVCGNLAGLEKEKPAWWAS